MVDAHRVWAEIFVDVASKLPPEALGRLIHPVRPLILLPPVRGGRVVRIHTELKAGASILQLDETLLSRPRDEAEAILAHELAHLMLAPSGDADKDDLAADALAARWGFSVGLEAALSRDVGVNHPRSVALKAS
jgi:hypothetical protein